MFASRGERFGYRATRRTVLNFLSLCRTGTTSNHPFTVHILLIEVQSETVKVICGQLSIDHIIIHLSIQFIVFL
jgi:hypothetical protein